MYNIGKLNKRISVVRIGTTADGYGGFTEDSESTIATCWAKVKAVNSDVLEDFGDTQNKVFVEFWVRKNAIKNLVRPTDLVLYNSNKYQVNKVYNVELDDFSKILGCRVD